MSDEKVFTWTIWDKDSLDLIDCDGTEYGSREEAESALKAFRAGDEDAGFRLVRVTREVVREDFVRKKARRK